MGLFTQVLFLRRKFASYGGTNIGTEAASGKPDKKVRACGEASYSTWRGQGRCP